MLELCDGDLGEEIKAKIAASEIFGKFKEFLEDLHSLHSMEFVHLDVKPKNMLIGQDGKIKVADLAFVEKVGKSITNVHGTSGYAAPEMIQLIANRNITVEEEKKTRVVNSAADMWSAGCCLYEMCTGGRQLQRHAQKMLGLGPPKEGPSGVDWGTQWNQWWIEQLCDDDKTEKIISHILDSTARSLDWKSKFLLTFLLKVDPQKRLQSAEDALDIMRLLEAIEKINILLGKEDPEPSCIKVLSEKFEKIAIVKQVLEKNLSFLEEEEEKFLKEKIDLLENRFV